MNSTGLVLPPRIAAQKYNLADFSRLPYSICHCQTIRCNVHNFIRLTLPVLFALLTGCASTPEPIAPPAAEQPKAAPSKPAPAPIKSATAQSAPIPSVLTETQTHEIVLSILPAKLQDKEGWADDMQSAFRSLQISPTIEHFCAVTAVTEQESSFQADPIVPGLPGIIQREIEQRREKYGIPQTVIDWMLAASSRDGRSYQQRINSLRTEKELSDLIEEIVAQVPAGKKLFPNYNPVRTGGPMQVSVEFAESHVRVRPYPYPINGSLRNEVFTRRGGLYFGSAILLDYPAPYDDMLYRFADFNAGRYSSRNAAFQQALSKLSGKALATDGDLLRYKDGDIAPEPSTTLITLLSIDKLLKMNEAEILRDLRLEKLSTFSKTPLYNRLFALADQQGAQPRVIMPEIDLKSPKIHRKLTTQWFANRVYGRYNSCLQRGGTAMAKSQAKSVRRK